jgi:N,N'-diacetylbacillosaminyl-diphospho-undecaprenol alpha-1,3-N-acetylgalactosaminyltransferase
VKVAVICPDAFTAWQFHRPWLLALRDRGVDVSVISAPVHSGDVESITHAGITHIPVAFERFISPAADLRFLARLYAILRERRFDYVHSLNLKCFIYGSLVAFAARVPRILGAVEGLGFAYTDPVGLRGRLLVRVMDMLSQLACTLSDKVWFVNSDDLGAFVSRGIIPQSKAVLIRSVGVDVADFSTTSIDPETLDVLKGELCTRSTTSVVTMVAARAVWSKGVREFVEACEQLVRQHPHTRFLLLAPLESGSLQAVPAEYLAAAQRRNPNLRWLSTFRRDVREILALTDVFTLPSYYREGVPKVLLEAMAMGKPIVTTDNVGCREVVEDGVNGILVPVRDSVALAAALDKLLAEPAARRAYGIRSREKVLREFADSVVTQRVLGELYAV